MAIKNYVVTETRLYDVQASTMKAAIKKHENGKSVQRESDFGDTSIVCQETGEEQAIC
jgi:hypothetical protein